MSSKNQNTSRLFVIVGAVMVGLIVLVKIFSGSDSTPNAGTGTISGLEEGDWVKGSRTAPVVLTEYSDFQCPACASYYPVVKQLQEQYGDKLAVIYRHFPLASIHPNAIAAAQAAEAAGAQNAFWQMHDMLFEKQGEWSNDPTPFEKFIGYARALNLDADKFQDDYKLDTLRDRVTEQARIGAAAGIDATPTFFVNGEKIQNPGSYEEFATVIEQAINRAPLTVGPNGAVHMHADLAVYINGKQLDFSADKYQSDEPAENSTSTLSDGDVVHLHNNKGTIVHVHKQGTTLRQFFESIGFRLSDTCLTTDTGTSYCADAGNSLKFFVNGARREGISAYVINDLDRLLVSYGPLGDKELQKQIAAVTDEACIYSEKCPERGVPPEEKCVGGLGTDCK